MYGLRIDGYLPLDVNNITVKIGSASNVQDRSLQCPSNVIWSFKIYLSQDNPSKHNPNLKMKTSHEVDIICPPQKSTSVGHFYYKK
jgi:hypothetical protein